MPPKLVTRACPGNARPDLNPGNQVSERDHASLKDGAAHAQRGQVPHCCESTKRNRCDPCATLAAPLLKSAPSFHRRGARLRFAQTRSSAYPGKVGTRFSEKDMRH